MAVRANRLLPLADERRQTPLLAELRCQIRIILRPRVRPATRRRQRATHVADLLQQPRCHEVAERRPTHVRPGVVERPQYRIELRRIRTEIRTPRDVGVHRLDRRYLDLRIRPSRTGEATR